MPALRTYPGTCLLRRVRARVLPGLSERWAQARRPPHEPAAAVSAQELATGARIRMTGRGDGLVALCLNGGTGRELPGTWSASVELLVRRCAPELPDVGWAEVRYRVRSWRQLEMCIDDGHAALEAVAAAGAREVVLVGYSMGGAGHRRDRRAPVGATGRRPGPVAARPARLDGHARPRTSRSSTVRSTATSPASRASARTARAEDSNGCWHSAREARTRRSLARSTRSRCARRGGR